MVEAITPAELPPSFLKFSEQEFYISLNSRFIKSLRLRGDEFVLDLASGPGNTSKILDQELGPKGIIVAFDISQSVLIYAKKNLKVERPFSVVLGTADQLPFISKESPRLFDVVLCGNAIHNFPEKEIAIREVSRVLKPDGIFAFNLSFYKGAIPDREKRFNMVWVKKALGLLEEKGVARDKEIRVEARKYLTPEEYRKFLTANGFESLEMSFESVEIPLEGFKAIAEDDEFVAMLSGFPLAEAKKALSDAAEITFQEIGMKSSSRDWMKVVAVKKSERVLESVV